MSNSKNKTKTRTKKGAARLTPRRKKAQDLYEPPLARSVGFPTDPTFMKV